MTIWDSIIDEFCLDMQTEQNFKVSSLLTYKRILKKMTEELINLNIEKQIDEITELDMKAWKTNLLAKNKKHNTIRHHHSIVMKFFYWWANKYRMEDPTCHFRPIPEEIKDPFIPTPSDVARMIVEVGTDTFYKRRNAAIIALFAGTGIRLGEICKLEIGDITKKDHNFEVEIPMRKTRSRRVPFGDIENVDVLASTFGLYYIQLIAKGYKRNDPLFYHITNEINKKPLQPITIWTIVKKYGKVSALKRISPIELRHFFATYLYLGGVDIKVIQQYMGHALLSTTERYIHIAARIRSDTHKLHPLSKFKRPELTQVNTILKSI